MAKLSQIKLGADTYDIGAKWENVSEKPNNFLHYGVCGTAADTVAKTVTISNLDNFVLEKGAVVAVKFTNSNSASNPTLNVNGTGAKNIVRYGTTATSTGTTTTGWAAGAVQLFIYDGTSWVRDYWSNTTYSSMSIAEGTTGTATTSRVLTAANLKGIINAHAPTKTGEGASGTWDIDISGNADTATVSTRSQYLETWYSDKTKTYGSSYPLYAWWETSSECRLTVDNYTVKVNYADSAGTCTSLSTNAGSTTKAIYFSGGKPAQCSDTLNHSISGNAATATKLATARKISLTGSVTGSGSFDGSGNLSIATTTNHSHSYLPLTGGTLTGDTIIKSAPPELFLQSTAIDKGTAPSSSAGGSIWFMDKNGVATKNATGRIYGYNSNSGYNAVRIYAYKQEANSTDTAYLYVQYGSDGVKKAGSSAAFYGAVWNDYAEFRGQKEEIKPGYCVTSNRDGKVSKTTERMQYCEGIVSDTFGFSIGETDECKTPLAVSGRVLAYYNGNIEDYNIGDVVCAGANGKIDKMTREEIKEYPDRIIGTVSEFPEYETWGSGNVPTKDRIWIKVR